MITRSGRSDGLELPTVQGGSDDEASKYAGSEAISRASGAERSAGTLALLGAFSSPRDGRWAASFETEDNASAHRVAAPTNGSSSAASLEHRIRSNPAYRNLSTADRGVAEWILWRASLAEPAKRSYYLGQLDILFNTPYSKPPRLGESELEKMNHAQIDAALERERARGDVFKGQEEQLSASRPMTSRVGFHGTRYRVDGSDPRSVVVQLNVHLSGKPELVAKIKEFEDAIEKAASRTGYTVDLEFVNRRGSDVFEVKVDAKHWPVTDNWPGGSETLAHELHHLLGLDDRYDYIEAHADNQFMPVNERLYWFAVQMMKPPDPRGFASLMDNQFTGTLLSEDVCAVLQDHSQACLDARKEWDPPGLPAYDQTAR